MEASALRAPAAIGRSHISVGTPLLRLRSDEQLVALFRAGHEEAFRVIHDRYRQRLFAYARQMLHCRQDAEDALQDVFVRAYSGLRADGRQLALRAWLYRVAHNRCIDELRRPLCSPPEVLELLSSPLADPLEHAERRDSLKRLVADVRRLPDQQRSALVLRELSGMSYAELAEVLGVSSSAVKSLLVRARIGLVRSAEARDAACGAIREELTLAHDRGVRPGGLVRRHLRDCAGCRSFRTEMRGTSRQLAALAPALGPFVVVAKLLGIGAGGSGVGTSGAVAGGASGAAASSAIATSATHVATLLAAAALTAGGAVEIEHTLAGPSAHRAHPHRMVRAGAQARTPVPSLQSLTQASRHLANPQSAPVSQASAPSSSGSSSSSGAQGATPHQPGSRMPAYSLAEGPPTESNPIPNAGGSNAATSGQPSGADGTWSSAGGSGPGGSTAGSPGSATGGGSSGTNGSPATGSQPPAGGSSGAPSGSPSGIGAGHL